MMALDTNVLVRFLVKDDKKQAMAVYKRFKRAEAEKDVFFVPLLVVVEIIWVLEAVYSVRRGEIIEAIEELLLMPILEFEAQSAVRKGLLSAKESVIELSDVLIAHSAAEAGCDGVLTFDKKASKYKSFELLS